MKLFSKITLRAKLLVLVLLPFIVLGVFTFDKISREKDQISEMSAIRITMIQIEKMSSLTHEFQKERDFAMNFLLNPQMESQIQIEKQVYQTDSIIDLFRSYLINDLKDTTQLTFFSELKGVRSNITGFSLAPSEVQKYYNQVIDKFLDIVATIGSEVNTPLTKEEMKAYLSLVQTKESLGKIRNSINEALIFSMFQRLGYGEFSGQKGAFEYNLNAFLKYSPDELKNRFRMDLEGGTMFNTLRMIDYCFESKTNQLTDFTASDWWISSTGTINVLHELELFVINRIKNSLQTQENELQEQINSLYIMLSGVLTIVLLLVSFIAKSITSDLKKIEAAAISLQEGRTSVNVEVSTRDEIGKLAATFNRMAQNGTKLAEVADKIGRGDYDVNIEERSDEDVLGKALLRMKNNLKIQTSELKEKIEEIEQAYKYKSDFLANMSHELRTPLNSMLILSNLLAENKEGNLSNEEIQSAQVIHKSGANLLELINDILDLSKIEAGKFDVEIREFNLVQVIDHLNSLFQPIANENGLNFSVVQQSPIPENILCDELRLGQIIKNLISNSMKFTPSGGSVNLVLDYSDSILEFSVIDNGIGIPKEKQEGIFGAFNQADGSTSRNYGGTGLGLSITSNLVELLQGSISLESEEGAGAKFTVKIKLKALPEEKLVQLPTMGEVKEINTNIPSQPKEKKALKKEVKEEVEIKENKPQFTIDTSHKEQLSGKRMLIIDEDISNVFELSGKLLDLEMEIEEAGTLEELTPKMDKQVHFLLINYDSIKGTELEKIQTSIKDTSSSILEVGKGKGIDSISDIEKIVKSLVQLSNC